MFDLMLADSARKSFDVDPSKSDALDRATSVGQYEGFVGVYSGKDLPTVGWWLLEITEAGLNLTHRMIGADGALNPVYRMSYQPRNGWAAEELMF